MDGVSFPVGDPVLAAALVFGGCLSDRVAGAFFRVGTSSGSDSETDSDPELASPSVNSSKSDSDSNISVGGDSFCAGVGLEGAETSPVPVVVRSRWLNRGGSLLLLPCEKGKLHWVGPAGVWREGGILTRVDETGWRAEGSGRRSEGGGAEDCTLEGASGGGGGSEDPGPEGRGGFGRG